MSRPGPRVRVLAIHRYFWPDTPPYASLLRAIVGHWAGAGHQVDVVTSQPSYKPETANQRRPSTERVDGATVRRIAMRPDRSGRVRRVFNVVWFPLAVALRILRGARYDVVMCSTAPPVLLGAAVSWAATRRGATFVYHCMDLHPEIGSLSGEFSKPWVYRLLMRLELATCRRAAAVVVLSADMRESLVLRDPALASRVVVLNNADLPEYGEPADDPPAASRDDEVLVAFTGNLGRFQCLETVVAAVLASHPGMERVRLVLMGEGAAKAGLAAQVAAAPPERGDRVVLLPQGNTAQARALMSAADWGLVTLAPEVIRYAYPSKVATYLSEGLPVLAGVEPDSALVRDIEAWGVGTRLPMGSPEAVAGALAGLVARPGDQALMRARATEVWRREFSLDRRLAEWDALLERAAAAEHSAEVAR